MYSRMPLLRPGAGVAYVLSTLELLASMNRSCLCFAIACSLAKLRSQAQTVPPVDPPQLVQDVTRFQLDYLRHKGAALQFEIHRVDSKEDVTRVIIESAAGPVGRLIQRNGQPLTPDESSAEQNRLRALNLAEMVRRRRGEETGEKFGIEMVSAMPTAMLYTVTPGQPQLPNVSRPQAVLDFRPNPAFHPATAAQALLTGLEGRLWIDASNHHLLRMELHIVHNLNLAWGLLARVYSGGSLDYDQRDVGGGNYAYTRIAINVTLRELMVKTVPYQSLLVASKFQVMPSAPPLQEAVHKLLELTTVSAALPKQ